MALRLVLLLAGCCLACNSSRGTDARQDASGATDSRPARDAAIDAAPALPPDHGPTPAADRGLPPPDIGPEAELLIEQIHVGSSMGEAALVIGPDGTSVLIDTGGDSQGGRIIAAIERRLGHRAVDWVVLTHFHYDHIGAFERIFAPSDVNGGKPVVVQRGVVSRGLYDMGWNFVTADKNQQAMCEELAKPAWNVKRFDLCSGPVQASCSGDTSEAPWPATDCLGLVQGEIGDPGDDQQGKLSFIPLGGDARMIFFHANGYLATQSGVVSAAKAGVSVGHGGVSSENRRSLGGVIRWGAFRFTFHGDLEQQMEQFIAARSSAIVEAPGGPPLLPSGAVDMIKLSHHGYGDATSQAWVDWLLPPDGKSRNAVVGCSPGYVLAPDLNVVARLAARLTDGYLWITELGGFGTCAQRCKIANGALVVRVSAAGARYQVGTLTSAGEQPQLSFDSTVP